MSKEINEIRDLLGKAIESLTVPKEFLSELVNFGSTMIEWQLKDNELQARLIKAQDIYKESKTMKCHTCKFCFNTAYYGPPCREVDWESSDPKEYDFNKCLFYKEDKFEAFIQNLERNLDTNKEC